MPIVTLTTDFGQSDGYVGAMKGVILSIAPQATIVDISHQIEPANVRQAAYVLLTIASFFPPTAVHVAVVDPGVGTARRPIAVRTSEAYFVGPDNGVFTYVLTGYCPTQSIPAQEPVSEGSNSSVFPASAVFPGRLNAWCVTVVHLDRPQYWLPDVSTTFHGRDIFAPVAAHLAAGVPLESLGTLIDDATTFNVPQPERLPDGSLRGEVLHCDRFGNLISSIPIRWLTADHTFWVHIGGQRVAASFSSYAEVPRGHLLALGGSSGLLEIAVREGNAAQLLGLTVGAPVIVWPGPPRTV